MTHKFNYKIYNNVSKTYYKGCKKTTWQQKGAVINYIQELTNGISYRRKEDIENIENIEVHIFPLEDAIVKTANDFLEENREDIEIKKLNKQEKERKRQENNLKWKIEQLEKQLKTLKNENKL